MIVIVSFKEDKPYRLDKCCIHVPTNHEKKECWITGSAVLSPDRVVVVDGNNKRVKLINTRNSEIVSRLVLSACPKDVAMVTADRVVITLPSLDTVQFLSIKKPQETLDIARSFKVEGYCCGIDCFDDKLFISYSLPAKVEMFSFKGERLNTFATDSNGTPLFRNPQYLAANGDAIFVSDSDADAVVKVSHDGEAVAKYADSSLKNPQGVAITSDDRLLVASQGNHTVHLLNTNCGGVSVVLGKEDGLWWPHVLEVCPDTKTVYISSTSGHPEFDNFLSMYTFEHD